MNPGGKGSTQRPANEAALEANWKDIEWMRPEGRGEHPECGHPFCDCRVVCEKKEQG